MNLSKCSIQYTKINTKFLQRLEKYLVKYSSTEKKPN